MKKIDLIENVNFINAAADIPIRYVQADGRVCSLGKLSWVIGVGKFYWNVVEIGGITKRELLNNCSFCSARNDSEILIRFTDYKRETWKCDVDVLMAI